MSRILVSGAGISGTVFAHWASRAGFLVSVVEKTPSLRDQGQNIDIKPPSAQDVIKRMGPDVWSKIESAGIGERGMSFVDDAGRAWGKLALQSDYAFTSEIEIPRGVLSRVLYEATVDGIEWIFDDSIVALHEDGDRGVQVELGKGGKRHFDLVVGADGIFSPTRKLAFPDIGHSCVKSLGQYIAHYALPSPPRSDMYCEWYNTHGRRQIIVRPNKGGYCHVILGCMPREESIFDGHWRMSVQQQKEIMSLQFQGVRYHDTQKLITGMLDAQDFYLGQVAQVKLTTYYRGRVALIGDAAACPSPYSGQGTPLAIISAYVLAGELLKSRDGTGRFDASKALKAYDEWVKPYFAVVQKLVPGLARLANPDTILGVWTLRAVLTLFTRGGLLWLISKVAGGEEQDQVELPLYDFPVLEK